MSFSEILENPTQTALLTWVVGVLLSEDLDAGQLSVLGRLIIDVGEAFVTRAVILAAREAANAAKDAQASDTEAASDECSIKMILGMVSDLYSKNKCLQEQVWELQFIIADLQAKINR